MPFDELDDESLWTVLRDGVLGLDMWDQDLSVHELIMACNVSLTAALLRSGTGSCSNDGGAKVLRFTVVPR